MDKVFPEPNTGCWLWGASFNKSGYGKVGKVESRGFNLAHRYSFYIHNGDFDRSLFVQHLCDNPACVNPEHLTLGNYQSNNADRHKKGRNACGEKVHRAKFRENEILNIRNLYKCGKSVTSLSIMYGVTDSAISKIVHRKNWKHI